MKILIITVITVMLIALLNLISKINDLKSKMNEVEDTTGRLFDTLKLYKRYREFDKFASNIYEARTCAHLLKLHWENADRKQELILEYSNRLIKAIDTALGCYKPFKDDTNEHQDISVN